MWTLDKELQKRPVIHCSPESKRSLLHKHNSSKITEPTHTAAVPPKSRLTQKQIELKRGSLKTQILNKIKGQNQLSRGTIIPIYRRDETEWKKGDGRQNSKTGKRILKEEQSKKSGSPNHLRGLTWKKLKKTEKT
jgi:hypothetical protein